VVTLGYAIIGAVRKWLHLLSRNTFTLVTDQRSVFFKFDSRNHAKIKNDKVRQWRMELSPFSYVIQHRPGKQNRNTFTLVTDQRSASIMFDSRFRAKIKHDNLVQ